MELGYLVSKIAAFLLRAQGIVGIAVGLLHLANMDLADFVLGFRRFFHGGIEQLEILVFGFGLRQALGAALPHPAIGDGQFGFGQIFAGIVGVDQRIQRQPGDFIAAFFDIVDGFVEQNLVGLLACPW